MNEKDTGARSVNDLRITLLIVIVLTFIASAFAMRSSWYGAGYAWLITGTAILKFAAVAYFFMDVRHAHNFWKVLVFILSLAILAGVMIARG
jgi:heme/copper-type cytochrome/quinol oxidase subunit 4